MIRRYTQVLCVLLAASLLVATMTGCSRKQPPEQTKPANETQGGTEPPAESQPEPSVPIYTEPGDEPYTEPPTQPPVKVVMPEYELSYSGPLADLIQWQEQPENGSLAFSVQLSTGNALLFTLLLDQAEGEIVIMKENGAGQKVPVSFQMAQAPESLSQEDRQTFLMAQDMVNEIIASLTLK